MKKATLNGSILRSSVVGGSILSAAMALTGCMGGTSAATADLAFVPTSVESRTDLFVDLEVSSHLLTATQIGDSTTAIPVDVRISEESLIAMRHGTQEVVARWDALQTLDATAAAEIPGATTIDGELRPGENGPITVPGGGFERFGDLGGGGHGTIPNGAFDPSEHPGLLIDWSERTGGIPDSIDVEEFHNVENAHPGCA